MSSLLDPAFIRRLDRLRLLSRRRFAGSAGGSRASLRRGASVELADHRPYAHGDDMRRIDWNAYARLEELVLRLYVAEEDLVVYLLVDTSSSLAIGEPPKIELAKRVAAALGYVGLRGNERIRVVGFGDGLVRYEPAVRGQRQVGKLLRSLDGLTADGKTSLVQSVEQLLARRSQPGLVLLISDLLDPAGYERPIDRLLSERFEVALFHILDREEIAPASGGDMVLVDSESGGRVEVTLDAEAIAAYERRLGAFLEGVEAYARRRGISYVRLTAEDAFEELLLRYLRSA